MSISEEKKVEQINIALENIKRLKEEIKELEIEQEEIYKKRKNKEGEIEEWEKIKKDLANQ